MASVTYPINFDFGKHWDSKIRPFLLHPKIKLAIYRCYPNYSCLKPPAFYTSTDAHSTLMEKKKELALQRMRENKELPPEYLFLEKNQIGEEDEGYEELTEDDERICCYKFHEIEEDIAGIYDDWRSKLESYVGFNDCHLWNPTFGLTLAELVEPEEKWRVRSSPKHTTVINENNTKVFDIVFWSVINRRIDNYVLGEPLTDAAIADITLGGKDAYINSSDGKEENARGAIPYPKVPFPPSYWINDSCHDPIVITFTPKIGYYTVRHFRAIVILLRRYFCGEFKVEVKGRKFHMIPKHQEVASHVEHHQSVILPTECKGDPVEWKEDLLKKIITLSGEAKSFSLSGHGSLPKRVMLVVSYILKSVLKFKVVHKEGLPKQCKFKFLRMVGDEPYSVETLKYVWSKDLI